MQLLVSVRSAPEAQIAIDAGADVVDAKEPRAGALGPVALATCVQIVAAVAGRGPVSAALGDLCDERPARQDAQAFAQAGVAFVKVGFAGIDSEAQIEALIAAAAAGAAVAGAGLVAVAYADYRNAAALPPDAVLRAAIRGGARGVLIDTVAKDGPSLLQIVPASGLGEWVGRAHASGMTAAVAGRLRLEDMPLIGTTAADIVGVRGAACEGGREGRISLEKIQRLRAALRAPAHHRPSTEDLTATSAGTRDPR